VKHLLLSYLALGTLISLIVGSSAYAQRGGGSEGTGGGDHCEERIQEIRDDIAAWIDRGGSRGLEHLPIPVEEYNRRMSLVLSTEKQPDGSIKPFTKIECVHHPIEVQEDEKVCRFDRFRTGPKITCYSEAFLDKNTMSVDEQYRLIHHEYAGVARLEVPSGSQSSYPYSKQVSAFLENQVVKRLGIQKHLAGALPIVDFPVRPFSQLPADAKIVFTKPLLVPAGVGQILIGEDGGRPGVPYAGDITSTCSFDISPSAQDRQLELGPNGYRAFDFTYASSQRGTITIHRITLLQEGKAVMSIHCTDFTNEDYYPQLHARFFNFVGIKLLEGTVVKF
jgi:hypothetical protein